MKLVQLVDEESVLSIQLMLGRIRMFSRSAIVESESGVSWPESEVGRFIPIVAPYSQVQ